METLSSVKDILKEVEKRMEKSKEALHKEFQSLRTGRASAALVEGVQVNYYNALTPLKQLATISAPEPRSISIQPWDMSGVNSIMKGIQDAKLGLTPVTDGKIIRIQVPELTDERRSELTKVAKKYAEESRVSVRGGRKEANDALKRLEKDGAISEDESHTAHEEVQKLTDRFIKQMDELLSQKEKDINTV